MKTVNITVTSGDMDWICGRLARELVTHLPKFGFKAVINGNGHFDVEYASNAYAAPKGTGRVSVALFAQEDHHMKWVPSWDGHVALNPFVADLIMKRLMIESRPLKDINVRVIEQAVDTQFHREFKPVFGVAGSVKKDGRKGEALVQKMVDAGYVVRAWGKGWPCEIVSDDYAQLISFYKGLDYYVVTSTMEGGCTPIIECMSMAIPVIAPRIGFAIVRPVIEYEKGNWDSLHKVLRYLTEHRTYEDWARDHAEHFERCLAGATR